MPAIPAMAQTISVPGFGNFDIPEIPQNFQQQLGSPEAQTLINQAPAQVRQVVDQVMNQAAHVGVPAPFAESTGQRALDAARSKIGTPYVWGGASPGGFDCSGLVKWSYAQAGVQMPRTSFEQAQVGAPVAVRDLQPGDVIIANGGSHAALYAGDGQILHASVSGQPVKYSPLDELTVYTARRL